MAVGSAADIGIRVFLDDAAGQGLFSLNSLIRDIGGNSQLSGAKFAAMVARMTALGVVIGAGVAFLGFAAAIKYSVDAATEFQQSMFSVALATHVPMVEAMKYTQQLMNLAAGSTYSSQQIADGMVILGRSGYTLQEIMGNTANGMSGMAAAGVALGIATRTTATEGFRLLAQAMVAYHLPASQAMQVADLLQFAFEHQTGSVAQLTAALSQVTPSANQFHMSLKEVLVALDTIGPAMSTTATAGTGLRYMLNGIYSPTAAARTELVALKLATIDASGNFHSAFYDAKGKALDFSQSIEILFGKLQGMSEEARNNALHSLFSVRGGQGANVLFQQIQTYLQYLGYLKQHQDNAGAALQRWQQMMQTAAGAEAGLSSSIKDLGTVVGLALLPYIAAAATALNNFVSWVRGIVNASPGAAQAFLFVGAAVSALGVVAGITALAIMQVAIPFMILGGVILGTVAVIAGLTIGITLLITHWHQVTAVVQAAIPYISQVGVLLLMLGAAFLAVRAVSLISAFSQLIPVAISFAVTLFTQTIPALLTTLVNIAGATAIFIGFAIANASTLIPSLLASAAAWMLNAAAELVVLGPMILLGVIIAGMIVGIVLLVQHLGGMSVILSAAHALWSGLVSALQQAGAAIKGAFLSAVQQLRPIWQQLIMAFFAAKPALMDLGMIFGAVLAVAIGIFVGVLRGALNVVVVVITTIIHVAAGLIQAFMGVIQFFMGFFQLLHGLVTLNGNEIQAAFHTMGTGILNVVTGLWNAVKAVFVGAFQAVVGFVSGFVQGIVGFFRWLAGILIHNSIIPDMLHAILALFISILTAIAGFIQGILAHIGGIFSAFGSFVHGVWTALWSAVQALLQAAMNAIISLITFGMFHSLGQVIAAGAQIIGAMRNAWNMVTSAVHNGVGTVMSVVGSLPGRILGALGSLAGQLFSVGSNIIQALANGIMSAFSFIGNAMSAVGTFIHDHLPHSPAKIGPLRELPYQASMIPQQIAEGILGGTPIIQSALHQALGGISGAPGLARMVAPSSSVGTGATGGSGVKVIQLVLNGRVLAQGVLDEVSGQMQMNGLGRSFR